MRTGDILKIRNLVKEAKDEKGRYIYTAYLKSALHEYDEEPADPQMNVCFTSNMRIEDIIDGHNSAGIRSLLNFLTSERPTEDEKKQMIEGVLEYIGDMQNGTKSNMRFQDLPEVLQTRINQIATEQRQLQTTSAQLYPR